MKLATAIVNTNERLWRSPLSNQPVGKQVSRIIANRLVPYAVKAAFKPGVHHINGVQFMIPAGTQIGNGGEYHMALGTYERGELRYVLNHMQPGGGMVDVGAHIGYFAIAAARRVGPNGHIFAIEPTSSSAATLRVNVDINQYNDRVTVFEGAASDTTGTGALRVSGTSAMFNTLEADTLSDETDSIPVQITTIDDLLAGHNWPRIDLIKMDVEGHERSVLEGCRATFAKYPNVAVLFEASGTSDERLRVSLETIDWLAGEGFGFSFLGSKGEVTATDRDGLIERMRLPSWQDALFNVAARRTR